MVHPSNSMRKYATVLGCGNSLSVQWCRLSVSGFIKSWAWKKWQPDLYFGKTMGNISLLIPMCGQHIMSQAFLKVHRESAGFWVFDMFGVQRLTARPWLLHRLQRAGDCVGTGRATDVAWNFCEWPHQMKRTMAEVTGTALIFAAFSEVRTYSCFFS